MIMNDTGRATAATIVSRIAPEGAGQAPPRGTKAFSLDIGAPPVSDAPPVDSRADAEVPVADPEIAPALPDVTGRSDRPIEIKGFGPSTSSVAPPFRGGAAPPDPTTVSSKAPPQDGPVPALRMPVATAAVPAPPDVPPPPQDPAEQTPNRAPLPATDLPIAEGPVPDVGSRKLQTTSPPAQTTRAPASPFEIPAEPPRARPPEPPGRTVAPRAMDVAAIRAAETAAPDSARPIPAEGAKGVPPQLVERPQGTPVEPPRAASDPRRPSSPSAAVDPMSGLPSPAQPDTARKEGQVMARPEWLGDPRSGSAPDARPDRAMAPDAPRQPNGEPLRADRATPATVSLAPREETAVVLSRKQEPTSPPAPMLPKVPRARDDLRPLTDPRPVPAVTGLPAVAASPIQPTVRPPGLGAAGTTRPERAAPADEAPRATPQPPAPSIGPAPPQITPPLDGTRLGTMPMPDVDVDLAALPRLGDALTSTTSEPGRGMVDPTTRTLDMARSIQGQLVDVARSATDGAVEVKLAPEELGRVRMTITQTDAEVVITVLVERAETLELMRRHADTLSADLRQAGFERLSFSFGQGSNSDPSPQDQTAGSQTESGGASDLETDSRTPRAEPQPMPKLGGTTRLDIRL